MTISTTPSTGTPTASGIRPGSARRTAAGARRARPAPGHGDAVSPLDQHRIREDLARLDRALVVLEGSEALLAEAATLRGEDPRAAFELVHRAALRAAGVVIDQANRGRVRRLPLNAWVALSRCGEVHRAWAQEVAPMVAERARLDAHPEARVDPTLLDAHTRGTRERIAAVRAEITVALLPAAVGAGA